MDIGRSDLRRKRGDAFLFAGVRGISRIHRSVSDYLIVVRIVRRKLLPFGRNAVPFALVMFIKCVSDCVGICSSVNLDPRMFQTGFSRPFPVFVIKVGTVLSADGLRMNRKRNFLRRNRGDLEGQVCRRLSARSAQSERSELTSGGVLPLTR
jgi:hypothetical protein